MIRAQYVRASYGEAARLPGRVQGQPAVSKTPVDNELVTRSQAGDIEAFGELYTRYERVVYRMALCMLGDAEDADDIKQNAFLKAYRSIGSFRGEASFSSWVLKIATNLCRDQIKARDRRKEVALNPDLETRLWDPGILSPDPASQVERQELERLIVRVLAGLPEKHRELIVLRDMEGLSYAQIGDIIGTTAVNVKLRLFRARCNLRERVDSVLNVS